MSEGAIYMHAEEQRVVITWAAVPSVGPTSLSEDADQNTFQLVLHCDTGAISVSYRSITPMLADVAVVGVGFPKSDPAAFIAGTSFTTYSFASAPPS